MKVVLGIDTGGTYTDAVLVNPDGQAVLASSKALTTYHDLSLGIGQAVSSVLESQVAGPDDIELVALSTTLATNALVEGTGSPVCLLLLGYDQGLITQYGFEDDLVTQDVVYVQGRHDGSGNETEPLDEEAVRQAVTARRDHVSAFAISGYFGVRNPAHELRVRALVEEITGKNGNPLPTACGHELTTQLNAVRRATTVALNARLIPLLRELIATVRNTLSGLGLSAPLMVVRGDGSLVRAEWAMNRPIETILSGPAASVIGAWHLAGRADTWVIDMGGTTTDMAVLADGLPRLNVEGAQVGRWRTMVEAVDVHTVGLGGDSLISLDSERELHIGPKRVIPLCLLSHMVPGIKDELRQQLMLKHPLRGLFVLATGNKTDSARMAHGLSDADLALLDKLRNGPCALAALAQEQGRGMWIARRVWRLASLRLVKLSGFTPTDALHVLGRFSEWDGDVSALGADLLADQMGLSSERLCEMVTTRVSERVATELVTKVLGDEGTVPDWVREPAAFALLANALGQKPDSDLACSLSLKLPVVAIGAPVGAYLPQVGETLNTELVLPPYAEVANAVGAAVSGVVQKAAVLIRPLEYGSVYRLHHPNGVRDFDSLDACVAHAEILMSEYMVELARLAGTDQIEVRVTREDHLAPIAHELGGEHLYLGTDLVFTALGRPSPARGQNRTTSH